jgi:hypothetical protein
LPSLRDSLVNAFAGIILLVISLALAFSSFTIRSDIFSFVRVGIDPYFELLSIVSLIGGAYFMFRAGREMPRSNGMRKSLAEQVKSVEEKQ